MIRILLADDHTIVREGLKQLLGAAGDLEVVGEARNGLEVIERVRALQFDLLLLDMSMPGMGGIELIKQVRAEKPRVRILVLGMHEEQQYAARAIRAGAGGYLTKESASRQLVDAIRKVAGGGAFISATPDAEGPLHAALSDREFQIFRMIAEGKAVPDIAAQLDVSVKTVGTHKANILRKMNMSTTAQLIRYAIDERLVDEGS